MTGFQTLRLISPNLQFFTKKLEMPILFCSFMTIFMILINTKFTNLLDHLEFHIKKDLIICDFLNTNTDTLVFREFLYRVRLETPAVRVLKGSW
jgi:hypothetical protein